MSARSVEFLQIEPTRHCNFHCLFCQGRFLPKAELETGVLKRALAGLEGVRYVEFQGEGEPFLYPGCFNACRAILERFPGAEISTISNGSTLVPAVRGKLAGGPVAHILVSMETSDPDDFRFLRGGDLTQILENVRELRACADGRPRVGLAVTVLRDRADQLEKIVVLYDELGLDGGISVQYLQNMESYASHYGPELAGSTFTAREQAEFERTHAAVLASVARVNARDKASFFYSRLFDGWSPADLSCPWLDHGAYLSAEGTESPCCYIKDGRAMDRERLADALAAGVVPPPCEGCFVAREVKAAGLALSSF